MHAPKPTFPTFSKNPHRLRGAAGEDGAEPILHCSQTQVLTNYQTFKSAGPLRGRPGEGWGRAKTQRGRFDTTACALVF
jgi:hypothetical protein